jgi:cytochrome c oxidase subunit 3
MGISNRTLFHLVAPSPWPLTTAASVFIFLLGLVGAFQEKDDALFIILLGFGNLFVSMSFWFCDVIKESIVKKKHTPIVANGLRLGFILFIVSEAILFGSFFGAYFYIGINPTIEIGFQFPSSGIPLISPFGISLLNTLLLLTSGYVLTLFILQRNLVKYYTNIPILRLILS